MGQDSLHLKSGEWLVADCGKMPSDSHCQLIMLAPSDQREDLVDAGVKHAVHKHGHQDDDDLRQGVNGMLEVMVVA